MSLLRQLLAARSGRRSEQITEEQLALFEAELKTQGVNVEELKDKDAGNGPDDKDPPASPGSSDEARSRGRGALPGHLKRERIVHDLKDAEKHCALCSQHLREFGQETSERHEYIPAQLIVIEDVRKKYSCACTVKTAGNRQRTFVQLVSVSTLCSSRWRSSRYTSRALFHFIPAGAPPSARRTLIPVSRGPDYSCFCAWVSKSALLAAKNKMHQCLARMTTTLTLERWGA
jgi:hypothetical protein